MSGPRRYVPEADILVRLHAAPQISKAIQELSSTGTVPLALAKPTIVSPATDGLTVSQPGELVTARAFAIVNGHEDAIDLDRLTKSEVGRTIVPAISIMDWPTRANRVGA